MDSQLTPPIVHNVHYEVPRFLIGEPGVQNRIPNGNMTITAGASYPIDFRFSNKMGIPLNLTAFDAYLIFWPANRFDMGSPTGGMGISDTSNITLRKRLDIVETYDGTGFALLSGEETETIGREARNNSMRWGVFLVNEDKHVFAMTVSPTGGVYGTVDIQTGTIPSYETIIG